MAEPRQKPVRRSADSQTFVVTVWQEEPSAGQTEWRGKVEAVPSGATRYFREWGRLVAILQQLLAKSAQE